MGTLCYGDNLDILRRYLKDESVDLVYLDPPFNSAQNYSAFFQEKDSSAAASNPGDMVLDPFCGCGTTIDAAEKLSRDWIGIDVTQLAISLIKKRRQDTYGSRLKFVSGA